MDVELIIACVVGAGALGGLWLQVTAGLRATVAFRTEMRAWRDGHEKEHARLDAERERTIHRIDKHFDALAADVKTIIANQEAHARECERVHRETTERLVALETRLEARK